MRRDLPGYVRRGGFVNPKKAPFQEQIPISLRNRVSGKGGKSATAACVQEMSVLFACLKKYDFKESACAKEVSSFQKCYSDFKQELELMNERNRKGILIPGEKRLTPKQADQLLKRFPS